MLKTREGGYWLILILGYSGGDQIPANSYLLSTQTEEVKQGLSSSIFTKDMGRVFRWLG
jgi:hypothetical protein